MNQVFNCENCGEKITGDNIRFCPFCGTKLQISRKLLTDFCSALLEGSDPRKTEKFVAEGFKFELAEDELIEAVLKQINNEKRQKRVMKPQRFGSRWTQQEDEQLRQEYLGKIAINEISKRHERSGGSIRARIIALYPEIIQENEKNDAVKAENNQKIISIGSTVTYLNQKTGELAEKTILPAHYEEKPYKGSGAYYDLETKREVIPPDITKNEISSESNFAKKILGKRVGETITVYPDNAKPYDIEIINVENK